MKTFTTLEYVLNKIAELQAEFEKTREHPNYAAHPSLRECIERSVFNLEQCHNLLVETFKVNHVPYRTRTR